MSALLSNCISTKTFNRMGYKVLLRNETSHTQFTKVEQLLIKELKDNGIVLEMPQNICQRGHSLTVFLVENTTEAKIKLPASGHYKEALFEVVAKVEKIDELPGENKMIAATLTFVQYDIRQWKLILDHYALAQEEINNLLMGQHNLREENE